MDFDCLDLYFDLSPNQRDQFKELYQLYVYWNAQINVVSRKDLTHFYEHHVLHALAIAKVIHFKPKTAILDVGTGGGFPGIPLAIMFPQANFLLIDAIRKKIKVVHAIKDALNLDNVNTQQVRAEDIHQSFDFIVNRAVTQMPRFMDWIEGKISPHHRHAIPNGVFSLKGGDLGDELASFPQAKIYDIHSFYPRSFFETKKIVYIPQ